MDQNITAAPPAPVDVPSAPPKVPAAVSPWTAGLLLCAGLIGVLAFLLGSFRVTNSDIWLVLATGRKIAAGEYQFGVDPFSWASDGAFWANQSWLASWFSYLLYQTLGSSSLVIAKAGLVVAMAGFLFGARSKDSPLLPGLELTALGVLAASPRFLLQTVVLSFVSLTILIWLLTRGGYLGGLTSDSEKRRGVQWQIPLLFLVWSNLDGYFVLGLLVVGLVAIGLAVFAITRPAARSLGIVFVISAVACVLNPHLLANFTLPTELAYIARGLLPEAWTAAGQTAFVLNEGDTGFYPIVSPFTPTALTNPNFAYNLAGLSFYVLVLVNLVSFVCCGLVSGTKGVGARGLVCLVLGILAALQIRLVPFYALAAAPISLLNFTDYARWARVRDNLPRSSAQFATWLTFSTLLLAVFFAWPGWLHLGLSQFHGDALFQTGRRAEWILEPDPSLRDTALVLKERAGEIHNVFNFNPEIAHYCAYFAPEVKGGIDARFALFAAKVQDYTILRNSLWDAAYEFLDVKAREKRKTEHAWPQLMAAWKLDGLVISNYHRSGSSKTGQLGYFLFQHPATWKAIAADGQTLAFAYSPTNAWPIDYLRNKWLREAFAQAPESSWLPGASPIVPPHELSWIEQYYQGRGLIPLPTSKALFEMGSFQKYATLWQDPYFAAYQSMHVLPAVGFAGMAPGHILAMQAAHTATLAEVVFRRRPVGPEPNFFHSVDFGPPSLPILAQRNLRRSLDENGNIALTHGLLAQNAKRILLEETWWARHQNDVLRKQLRQVQIATALRNALTLAPDNTDYYVQLAELFMALNFRDPAVDHLAAAIKSLDTLPVSDPNHKKAIDDQREAWKNRLKVLESDLKKRRNDFDLKTANATDMQKFRIAATMPWRFTDLENRPHEDPRGRGLVAEALKALLNVNPADLNKREKEERAFYLIRFNILQGKINEAADLYQLNKGDLGDHEADCIALISAATGWYQNLDKALASLENELRQVVAKQAPEVLRSVSLGLALNQLSNMPATGRIGYGMFIERLILIQRDAVTQISAGIADHQTLRGIYALEQGDTARALAFFEEALAGDGPFLDKQIALRYRDLLRAEQRK